MIKLQTSHANLRVEVAVGEDNLPAAVTISVRRPPLRPTAGAQAMIANDLHFKVRIRMIG